MAETASNTEQKLTGWFFSTCDGLWRVQRAFWTLLGLGAIASLMAFFLTLQWPFTVNKSLDGTFLGWCFHNSLLLLFIGLFYLACFVVVYIGHRYHRLAISMPAPTPTPEQLHAQRQHEEQQREQKLREQQETERERRYLQRMIRDTENLIPKGVPGVVASVPLDEVFIPLQFKPGQPPSDKPITEQERRWHRDFLQVSGHLFPQETSEEMERVLFESEHEYERILKERDRVDFAYLWQNTTRKNPAAVIQGYPGMGKSTLTQRLTLYMARRGLNLSDPGIEEVNDTQPILIPILIPLKEYADAFEQDAALTLELFLEGYLHKLGIPGVDGYILAALRSGNSLVMLDGLDEVSNPATRKRVQEEIRTFVAAHADVAQ